MKTINISSNNSIFYPVGNCMDKVYKITRDIELCLIEQNLLKSGSSINLWCRGSSGAILATVISSMLAHYEVYSEICHIKKAGEISHSGNTMEYIAEATDWIVDDFISSGDTFKAILHVTKHYKRKIAVIIMYGGVSKGYKFPRLTNTLFIKVN